MSPLSLTLSPAASLAGEPVGRRIQISCSTLLNKQFMIVGLSIFAPIAVLDPDTEARFVSLLTGIIAVAEKTLFPPATA